MYKSTKPTNLVSQRSLLLYRVLQSLSGLVDPGDKVIKLFSFVTDPLDK